MTPLISSYLAAGVRWIIALAVGYFVKHGADAAQANGIAAGLNPESISAFLVGVGTLVWSIYQKHRQNTAVALAAATGVSTATPTAAAVKAVSAAASTQTVGLVQQVPSIVTPKAP